MVCVVWVQGACAKQGWWLLSSLQQLRCTCWYSSTILMWALTVEYPKKTMVYIYIYITQLIRQERRWSPHSVDANLIDRKHERVSDHESLHHSQWSFLYHAPQPQTLNKVNYSQFSLFYLNSQCCRAQAWADVNIQTRHRRKTS
jgi:hypothetical protein